MSDAPTIQTTPKATDRLRLVGSTRLAQLIPPGAQRVMDALIGQGFQCFAVGGCVRDALRNKTPQDWDFTTDATTDEMKRAFDSGNLRWKATGEPHGTLTVIVDGEGFEVTTFRVDGAYSDNRHPDAVTFTKNLEEDLARRDFTINAMAWSPSSGIIDDFGGQGDLELGIIRAVGDPYARFDEDALRILRALRFGATLGFSIDDVTAKAAHQLKDRLHALARERVFIELDRLLGAENGIRLSALITEFSDIVATALNVEGFTRQDVYDLQSLAFTAANPSLRWAILLKCLAGPDSASSLLRQLRAPKALCHSVELLLRLVIEPLPSDRQSLRRLLVQCGSLQTFETLLTYHRAWLSAHGDEQTQCSMTFDEIAAMARHEIEADLPLSLKELAVNGDDLKKHGSTPGPALGKTLQALFEDVVNLKLPNDRDALLGALESPKRT